MNEHDLMEALEERVADVEVGPAPVDSMTSKARTTRRRRGVLAGVAAAAAAVVATVGVTTVLTGDDAATDPAPPAASDTAGPPEGFRYVGVDRAAVAVHEEWPTNALRCATPTESTVLVDLGPTCMMLVPYPAGTDSVEVRASYDGEDFSSWTPIEVDGVEALRSPDQGGGPASGLAPHAARVYLPSEEVVFFAQSSIGPDHVDDLLDGIVVLDDQVGVPTINDLGVYQGERSAEETYLERLEEAGLVGEVEPVGPGRLARRPGDVRSVDPAPGTVVDVGATVRVSVVR